MTDDRNRVLTAAAAEFENWVERGSLTREECDLALRAAARSDDPQYVAGFALVLAHHDPGEIPIAETVDALIDLNLGFSLRWPPRRWLRKSVQLRRLREFSPPPVNYTDRTAWLTPFLPSDRRRIRVIDRPDRLRREELRQGFGLRHFDPRLRSGRLAGISVLAGGRCCCMSRPGAREAGGPGSTAFAVSAELCPTRGHAPPSPMPWAGQST